MSRLSERCARMWAKFSAVLTRSVYFKLHQHLTAPHMPCPDNRDIYDFFPEWGVDKHYDRPATGEAALLTM